MLDILRYIPAKRKTSPSGWVSFDAPCCIHNGESQDTRQRGGLYVKGNDWSYHCFNCNFKTSFSLGRNLSFNARRLLSWMHVPEEEIDWLNLESLRHRNIEGIIESRKTFETSADIRFEERELPTGIPIEPGTPEYDYLKFRCIPEDYPLLALLKDGDHTKSVRPGVIVPFVYNNSIVGSTVRFLDDRNPRFINDFQPGYVFGTDLQKPNWNSVIVTEGIFDALCIKGLAVMHSTINDAQARLIRSLGKKIIVVPDQDKPGLELIDRAIELGWAVSIPDWDGCKDINDAVKKYGRVGTLLSIMQATDSSKIKIELRKKWLKKKLQL